MDVDVKRANEDGYEAKREQSGEGGSGIVLKGWIEHGVKTEWFQQAKIQDQKGNYDSRDLTGTDEPG